MSQFNPRIDFIFKKLFGSEENKDILCSFINSVLMLEHPIADVTLLNPFNDKNYSNDLIELRNQLDMWMEEINDLGHINERELAKILTN